MDRGFLRAFVRSLRELNVFRDVDDNRTGAACACDMKGLVNRGGQHVDVFNEIIVLGAGARDAGGVGFLEGVGADQVRGNLPSDADNGNRIHQRVGQARYRVGCAGAGGDKEASDFAGRAGVAFGCVACALFVTDEDVLDAFGIFEDFVVNGENRAAGIAENNLDTLFDKGLDHHFRAGHFAGRIFSTWGSRLFSLTLCFGGAHDQGLSFRHSFSLLHSFQPIKNPGFCPGRCRKTWAKA